MKKNIVLMGFMGTGKTTIGKGLSIRLNLSLYDMDDIIEDNMDMSINQIFEKFGERYFRELETKTLEEVMSYDGCIISTGGGIVLKEENWEIINNNRGVKISLMAEPKTIYNRLKDDNTRPLLKVERPFEKIRELLEKRKKLYLKADLILWTDYYTIEEIVDIIIDYYKVS